MDACAGDRPDEPDGAGRASRRHDADEDRPAYWRDDPNFRSRVCPPPVIPRLNVTVEPDDGRTQIRRPSNRQKVITETDVKPTLEDANAE